MSLKSLAKERFSERALNIAAFLLLVFVEAVQAVVVLNWLLRFIPSRNGLIARVFPEYAALAQPEREGFLYSVFIAVVAMSLALCARFFKDRWISNAWRAKIRPFFIVECVLTFLLLSALFKTVVYAAHPEFARRCFHILLAACVVNKIFWPQVYGWTRSVAALFSNKASQPILRRAAEVLCVAAIVIVLYLPNPEADLGRMFLGEQLHHFDIFIMAPGWAALSGGVMYKDAISQYGVGAPIVLSHLAQWLGGFTYLNVFMLITGGCILYYILSYVLLRVWFGSISLAFACVLVAIRTNLFHPGILPFVFTYPQATPIRYFWDVLFFFFIFFHVRSRRRWWLILAALCCGFSMFYVDSTGVFMTIAFYAYLLAHFFVDDLRPAVYTSRKDLGWTVTYFLLAPVFAVGLFYLAVGNYFFDAWFWHNMGDYVKYFINGAGTIPMYDSLFTRDFLNGLMGFVIPLVYVFTMLLVGTLCYLKKIKAENIFVVVLCVYGLGVYHYYVSRSSTTNFYVVGVPFFWVLGFWINTFWQGMRPALRQKTGLVMVLLALYALLTNHMFVSYPNLINLSRNPVIDLRVVQLPTGRISYFSHLFREYPDAFKLPKNSLGETFEGLFTERDFLSDDEVKAWFRQEFDFKEDAALISRLVPEKEKAALISSFEVKMLMQAKRQPFFYYFPLVNSRPLRMRNFVVGFFHSPDYLKVTLGQLQDKKPEYVFMERIFLTRDIPPAYYYDSAEIMKVLTYVYDHYVPAEYGKYLVAMKRRVL